MREIPWLCDWQRHHAGDRPQATNTHSWQDHWTAYRPLRVLCFRIRLMHFSYTISHVAANSRITRTLCPEHQWLLLTAHIWQKKGVLSVMLLMLSLSFLAMPTVYTRIVHHSTTTPTAQNSLPFLHQNKQGQISWNHLAILASERRTDHLQWPPPT